jgi:hypothetical protein
MAFNQMNGNNFNNNGDKPRTNFPLCSIRTNDGNLKMSVWKADFGVAISMTIYAAAGKDPTTGRVMYEQRKPMDLPGVNLWAFQANALRLAIKDQKADEPANINVKIQVKSDTTLEITSENGNIKVTITDPKGTRSCTMESMSVGSKTVNPNWNIFQQMITIGTHKAVFGKLDPDEFGNELGGSDNNDEEPF